MKLKSRTKIGAVVGLTAVLVGFAAAPAFASGTGYDNTNPATTGCSATATPIKTWQIYVNGNGANVGEVQVMYSTACGTNWVRVDNYGTSDGVSQKYIQRPAQGSLPESDNTVNDTYVGWSFGNQVYAPGSTCIWVQGGIVTGAWTAFSPFTELC